MINHTAEYKALHSAYCRLTRRDVAWNMSRLWVWEQYAARLFSEADLALMVKYLRLRISQGRRHPESLKFSTLLHDLDKFEEDLLEAKQEFRKPTVNRERASTLRATGRSALPKAKEALHVKVPLAKLVADLRRSIEP
jgi:hypothetical protein